MSRRNPHATNLRHHKPKRIEDKRDKLLGRFYADPDEWEARECPTGNSAR